MAVSKAPSITPETSSGEGLDEEPACRGETKWKRFHPFRVVRKIFRRRVKRQGTGERTDTSKKSWSTSELQSVQDTSEKYEVPSPPYKIGLSVSHDSIFSPESSNLVISEDLNRPQGSSLSVQHVGIKSMFQDELFSRVRARRDSEDDDDDIGLPHSPCTSPTTIDVLVQGLKGKPMQSGSLSAGSLVSMASSENDEDSAVASSSGNSSRMSLLDRKTLDFECEPEVYLPLNHTAAHHKISVRPKRTHGLPQKRLKQLTASRLATLPTTLEVTEDAGKINSKFESHEVVATAFVVHEEVPTKIASTSEDNIVTQSVTESVTETVNSQRLSKSFLLEMCISENTSASQATSEIVETDASASFESEGPALVQNDALKQLGDDDYSKIQLDSTSVCPKKEAQGSVQCMESTSSANKVTSDASSKLDFSDEISKTEEQCDNVLLKQAPLCVSALIKNIEWADSFSKQGNDKNFNITSKLLEFKDEMINSSADLKTDRISQNDVEYVSTLEEAMKPNSVSLVTHDNLCHTSHANEEANSLSVKSCSDKYAVLPEANPKNVSNAENKLHMEIRHQFQQQKAVKSQEQYSGAPRLYSEEESIMSEKHFENMYSAEESWGVTISHQIPHAVEAHNLVTVDKSFGTNVQNLCTREKGEIKAGSYDALVFGQDSLSEGYDNVSNIVVHSLISNTCSQIENEEKVTISVNSKSEESRTQNLDTLRKMKESMQTPLQNMVEDRRKSPCSLSSLKPSRPGDKPPVIEKVVSQTKGADPSKRLSVEIVPFSQRIKDRKYQPLLFSNKSPDTRVNPGGVIVERNLSDRRTHVKNKDPEKANNRHSFSGSLSVDVEKTSLSAEKKPSGKVDKLHYPVQIRIHKNKTYEKDNHFHKSRVSNEVEKSASPDTTSDRKQFQISKTVSEGTANNAQAKWEVKVHSTSQVKKDETLPQEHSDVELKDECIDVGNASYYSHPVTESKECVSQPLVIPKSIPEKNSPTSSLIESALLKNRENIRKSNRETQSSEDPEPELLRVFARRSIKQKHCDKEDKLDDHPKDTTAKVIPPNSLYQDRSADSNAQPDNFTSTADVLVNKKYDTTPELFKGLLRSPDLVKKKSKSFCDKEKHGPHIITPLKEVGLNRRPSLLLPSQETLSTETFHQRQRLVSEPNIASVLPPTTDNISISQQQNNVSIESTSLSSLHRATPLSSPSSTLSNGSSIDILKGKDNPDILNIRDGSAPSWLQLAQQRRELREQRERLLIGSSANSFLDQSSKPSRSSKVWDMVNNFQKMQMT